MLHRLISIVLLSVATLCAQAQSSYPVISKSEQRAKDDDRLPLLESELALERKALAKARREPGACIEKECALDIHRHEENIKSLQREIQGIDIQDLTDRRERPAAKAVRPASRIADSRRSPTFWNPYNRASDTDEFSTSPRRDRHD
jgi:hypothetical protein